MANRNFPSNKLYNSHVMPCIIDMQIAIGATGAPTLSNAPYVKSISRKAAGIYQVQLMDNFYSFLGMDASMISPVTGSAIDPNSGVVGSVYQISTVGNSNWTTAGVPATITPAVGTVFVLAAAPSVGTGRIKLISPSNIAKIEMSGPMQNSNNISAGGAIFIFQCLANSDSAPVLTMNSYTPAGTNDSSTPPIFTGTPAVLTGSVSAPALSRVAADPTQGSVLQIALYLNNSSVQ